MRKSNPMTILNTVHNKKFPRCSRRISALACAGLLAVSTVSCGKPAEPADSTDITSTPSAAAPSPTGAPDLSSDNNISSEDSTNTTTPEKTPSDAPAPTTPLPSPTPAVYGIPNQTSVYSATESNYTLAVDASNAVHGKMSAKLQQT